MKQPRYLKQYEGVTSGSFAGRDDGYPETKFMTFSDVVSLSKDYGKRKDEQYFKLVPIAKEELEKEVAQSLEAQHKQAKIAEKTKIENQIKELQNKLKDLDA